MNTSDLKYVICSLKISEIQDEKTTDESDINRNLTNKTTKNINELSVWTAIKQKNLLVSPSNAENK